MTGTADTILVELYSGHELNETKHSPYQYGGLLVRASYQRIPTTATPDPWTTTEKDYKPGFNDKKHDNSDGESVC